MYDHPPSRQGSPCPSIVGLPATVAPVKPHRTHSPIPHLSVATLLPHHHHHSSANCSRQYSPNSKQSDVSRLLDPSYASTSASSVNVGPSRAYVDHSGDLHDPDYRHFPVLPTPKKRVTSPTRRSSTNSNAKRRSMSANPSLYAHSINSSTRRASSGSTIAAMNDRYSTYPLVARPEWERDWATEVELDEDDEDEQDLIGDDESQDVHSPFYSSTPSSSSASSPRRSSLPPSIFAHHSSSLFHAEPVPAMTFSTTSSPVDSLDDDPVIHEEYHSYADESESSPRQKSQGLLRRMKRMSSANDVLNQPAEKPEYAEEHEMNSPQEEAPCERESKEEVDDVPSCTNGLRQQWRAFTLRLRFGVFHAKRRLSVSPITKRRKTI